MPHLVDSVIDTFRKHEVTPLATTTENYCFNIVGSTKKGSTLVVKVEEELEKCSIVTTRELANISNLLDTFCLIVSREYKGKKLIEGVFYRRYGIYAVSPKTLERLLKGERIPFIYTSQGGMYVKLDFVKIRAARERRGLSLGDLAYEVGVSRKAVYEYERGKMDASPEVAIKLEEVLNEDVIRKVTLDELKSICSVPMKASQERSQDSVLYRLKRTLEELGFKTHIFAKTPFHIASKGVFNRQRITKIVARHVKVANLEEKTNKLTLEVARAMGARAFFVTDKERYVEEEDVIVVSRDDLRKDVVRELIEDFTY